MAPWRHGRIYLGGRWHEPSAGPLKLPAGDNSAYPARWAAALAHEQVRCRKTKRGIKISRRGIQGMTALRHKRPLATRAAVKQRFTVSLMTRPLLVTHGAVVQAAKQWPTRCSSSPANAPPDSRPKSGIRSRRNRGPAGNTPTIFNPATAGRLENSSRVTAHGRLTAIDR
jgi:hypothetical protein